MPLYKILPGESFRDSDGSVKGGGQTIELCAEMALVHAGRIEPVSQEAASQAGGITVSGPASGQAQPE